MTEPLQNLSALRAQAEKSLRANLIETSQGKLCVAGAHKFKTLWARDFLYAVPGLLIIGEVDLVERQLDLLLRSQRPDGALPRGLDVVSPKLRVVHAMLKEPLKSIFDYKSKPLLPEYLGEHGTPAFDTNLLWLTAAHQFVSFTGQSHWLSDRQVLVDSAWRYYVAHQNQNGFWIQPGFSDWMDSLKREGPQLAFHAGLLALITQTETHAPIDANKLRTDILNRWFARSETWRTESTDALLICLGSHLGPTEQLIEEIKRRPLGVPHLLQASSEVSWTTKAVGLRHYHDGWAWSWLTAETARIFAAIDKDFSQSALETLAKVTATAGDATEIYDAKTKSPATTWIYKSEQPFSWAAAKIIEALNTAGVK